jgi:hypothetical protein
VYAVTDTGCVCVERGWLYLHAMRHLVLVHNLYVLCPELDIDTVGDSRGIVARCTFLAKPKASNVLCLSLFPLPVCMVINCFILCVVILFLCLMMLLDPCAEGWGNCSFRCEELDSVRPCLPDCWSMLDWP